MWNIDEDEPETVDGRPYIDVEAGDLLFGYWYSIPSETRVFKYNMAVTIIIVFLSSSKHLSLQRLQQP